MMSSAGTSRASKGSKDKTKHTQNAKGEGPPNPKGPQATAEQLRIAQMVSDNKSDPELEEKIKQVQDVITNKSELDIATALHDCDNDINRAVMLLMEGGDSEQGEWHETGKKKKRPQVSQNAVQNTDSPIMNNKSDKDRGESRDRYDNVPPRRGGRGGGPPRMNRGRGGSANWRGKENDENEKNREFGFEGGANREYSRDRGRGRGRGQMNGPSRGGRGGRRGGFGGRDGFNDRGGFGGRSPRFEGDRFDKGPEIDTWTNETAETAEKKGNSNTWEPMDDWNEEWTGNLSETQVFTASGTTTTPNTNTFSGATDAFSSASMAASNSTSDSVFSNANMTGSGDSFQQNALPQRLDLGALLQKSSQDTALSSTNGLGALGGTTGLGGPTSLGGSTMSGGPSLGVSTSLGVSSNSSSFGVSSMTAGQSMSSGSMSGPSMPSGSSMSGPSMPSSVPQQQFMSQFAKQATESIKNAVGIGSSTSPSQTPSVSQQPRPAVVMPPMSVAQQQQLQQQRAVQAKTQRTKLPPPSKIPASAVEMPHLPGGNSNVQFDVQFGNLDFGAEPSSALSFGGSDPAILSSYSASTISSDSTISNHVDKTASGTQSVMTSAINTPAASNKPSMASLDQAPNRMTTLEQSPNRNTVFPGSISSPGKDYSAQPTKINSPPEPIPFPSSGNKTSPLLSSQRPGQTNTMGSNKSSSTPPMTYGQSSYSTDYTSSYNKPMTTASGYSNSLAEPLQTTVAGSGQYGNNYQSGSSAFQSQAVGYGSSGSQGQSSLYPSTTQPSGYQTSGYRDSQGGYQSSGYSGQTGAYQTGNQYHSGSSQSSAVFQPSINQSGSSYQTNTSGQSKYQSNVNQSSYHQNSQTSGSSYQRENLSQNQSNYGSQGYGNTSTNKFAESLAKVSAKDTSDMDGRQSNSSQHSYDRPSSTSSASLTSATSTTSSSLASGTASVSSALGIGATSSTASIKTAPTTSKAPPNLPPGVPPVLGPNYIVGPSHGLPYIPQHVYPYTDELQLMQQRIQTMSLSGYQPYDMQAFQTPSTLATGRDQTGTLTNVPYSAGGDGKIGGVDAQSPIQGTQTSQQQTQTTPHQQQAAIFNPGLPPGYGYYYPGSIMPGGLYTQPVFPTMPPVTNTAHGGTTANTQFQQKPAVSPYTASHTYTGVSGYDDLSQGQDFKAYGGVSQTQTKGTTGTAIVTTGSSSITDLTGTAYTTRQSFDKQAFASTPPPFNLQLQSQTQTGPIAPGNPYATGTPFLPMVHQQVLHPHLTQVGRDSKATGRTTQQPKTGGSTGYNPPYWGAS